MFQEAYLMDQMIGLIFAAASFYAAAAVMALLLTDKKDGKNISSKGLGVVIFFIASGIFWIMKAELWNIREKNPGDLLVVVTMLLIAGIWSSFMIMLIIKDAQQRKAIPEQTVRVKMHKVQDEAN